MIPLSSARQQALLLLDNLTIIQTLQKTEEKLQELLLEESYPEAIRVLLGRCLVFYWNYGSLIQK